MRVLDAQGNPEQKETKQGVQTVDAMPTMQYTEKNIDESRRKCTLSSVMVENVSKSRCLLNWLTIVCIEPLLTISM